MKASLALVWDYLRSSFWFVPALMALGATALAVVLLVIDNRYGDLLVRHAAWLNIRDMEALRTLLSAVLGAIITALSVVFSVTIVALTLAVAQLGPRLLRNFMRDRVTQAALGTFVGTALYCLVVLWQVGQFSDTATPRLATVAAVALAFASLGILIFFIHHLAEMIQSPNVVMTVSQELDEVIDAYCPPIDRGEAVTTPPPDPVGEPHVLRGTQNNYVQSVDVHRLVHLAGHHDLVIKVLQRPGRFVVARQPLAHVWPADRVDAELAERIVDAFIFGSRRTPMQDIEFAIDELVEVALRALSPSINDPFTANACVDRLSAALSKLACRRMPLTSQYGKDGKLRLILDQSTFEGLANAAYDQIRQAAYGHPAVLLRMLERMAVVAELACSDEQRRVIWRHARMVHRGVSDIEEPQDRADLDERLRGVADAVGHHIAVDEDAP